MSWCSAINALAIGLPLLERERGDENHNVVLHAKAKPTLSRTQEQQVLSYFKRSSCKCGFATKF